VPSTHCPKNKNCTNAILHKGQEELYAYRKLPLKAPEELPVYRNVLAYSRLLRSPLFYYRLILNKIK